MSKEEQDVVDIVFVGPPGSWTRYSPAAVAVVVVVVLITKERFSNYRVRIQERLAIFHRDLISFTENSLRYSERRLCRTCD